jgi:hypothetical protein
MTWAVLRGHDLDRLDAEDPEHPGIVVDTPERREIAQFSAAFERNQGLTQGSRASWWFQWDIFESRRAALETAGPTALYAQIFLAGAFRDSLPLVEPLVDAFLERGELATAVNVACAPLRAALGDLASAERSRASRRAGETRGQPSVVVGCDRVVRCRLLPRCRARVGRPRRSTARATTGAGSPRLPSRRFCSLRRTRRGCPARRGPRDAAVERGWWRISYTALIALLPGALAPGRADFADVLERNLLAKTLAGDFRDLGVDARLAMAQLSALTGRPGDAHQWFERARAVLDEQGARPLRALVDLDEAWMEVRRGPHGDRDRARALLDVACEQFQAIGMPG